MKLALGTVQFGLNYGIHNQAGQTSLKEVKTILELGRKSNITALDTSINYGNSEVILGKVDVNNYQVITKTLSFDGDIEKVINGFYQSLKNLKQAKIYGLLIHNINDAHQTNFNKLWQRLSDLKQQGLIKKIGFSVYTPEQVDFLLHNFGFNLIQVPINIFDQRLIQGGQLTRLEENNVEIHARSVFLQGLLLKQPTNNYFLQWQSQFDNYFSQLEKNNINPLAACLNFANSITELDKIIVGVTNTQELQEIIDADNQQINISYDNFAIDDEMLINPALWTI